MDPLVSLSTEHWPRLRDSFNQYEQFGLVGYNLLDMQIHLREKGLDCDFKVYCPYGDISNGMVAKITKDKLHQIIITPNSEDTRKLEEALLKTSLIDWSAGRIEVPFVIPSARKCLTRVAPLLGIRLLIEGAAEMFVYSRNRQPYDNVKCPEGTYVGPVKTENIARVNEAWPHRYDSSEWVFSLFIRADLSYGLFRTEDDLLLAWLFVCEAGFLCHLYCEERHRKMGYAEFLVKYVTNDRLRSSKDAFCYIVDGNIKSYELFTKLRFYKVGKISWMFFKRKSSFINSL